MLAYSEAQVHALQALALASETGSLFWTRMASGYLATIAVGRHAPIEAEERLRTCLDSVGPLDALSQETPITTMSERFLWCAAIELSLERGEAERALVLADRLTSPDLQAAEDRRSLRVLKLRGESLLALSRLPEAEVELVAALTLAEIQAARPMRWRLLLALGRLYHQQGKAMESEQSLGAARGEIEALAATLPDPALREHFTRQAAALFPSPPLRSSQAAPGRDSRGFGGLTSREREVAILIARGESNQAIADTLVVTKRTVETHIGNILFKLGARTRTQIAVWAVESGLAGPSNLSSSW
jgi:DNA-binding CsgD family transcriptional regulator